MYQFILKSKKYGDKTVSIDDEDKARLFKKDKNGNDIQLYDWYLGYINKTNSFYAFRYMGQFSHAKQTLSNFLMFGERVFFADGNRLNCCRSNFVARNEITGQRDPLFDDTGLEERRKQYYKQKREQNNS